RSKGQDDVGHRGTMRRALLAFIRQRLRAIGTKDPALDRFDLLAALAEFLFEQRTLDAAVDDADGDAFAGCPRIAQQPLRREQGKDFVEDVAHFSLPSPQVSPRTCVSDPAGSKTRPRA